MKKIREVSPGQKMTVQLIMAVVLTIAGVALLWAGFFAPPLGDITPAVLTAFGEIGTFAGALFGVQYTYSYKMYKLRDEHEREIERYRNKTEETDEGNE